MTAIPDTPAGALRLPRLGRLGGLAMANDPDIFAIADFAPAPTLAALQDIVT